MIRWEPEAGTAMMRALATAAHTSFDATPDLCAVVAAHGKLHAVPEAERGLFVMWCLLVLLLTVAEEQREYFRALVPPMVQQQVLTWHDVLGPRAYDLAVFGASNAAQLEQLRRLHSIGAHGELRFRAHRTDPGTGR